jgi:hypothetical protein
MTAERTLESWERVQPRTRWRRGLNPIQARLNYIFVMDTEARVVSQSMFIFPALSKEMVKFSTGDGSVETFMSTRAKSFEGPG